MDEQSEKRATRRHEAERQVIIDYQKTFGSEHGSRVLGDLMEHCGMMRSSFQGEKHPLEMAFREGERAVVLMILDKLEIDVMKRQELIRERMKYAREAME